MKNEPIVVPDLIALLSAHGLEFIRPLDTHDVRMHVQHPGQILIGIRVLRPSATGKLRRLRRIQKRDQEAALRALDRMIDEGWFEIVTFTTGNIGRDRKLKVLFDQL